MTNHTREGKITVMDGKVMRVIDPGAKEAARAARKAATK